MNGAPFFPVDLIWRYYFYMIRGFLYSKLLERYHSSPGGQSAQHRIDFGIVLIEICVDYLIVREPLIERKMFCMIACHKNTSTYGGQWSKVAHHYTFYGNQAPPCPFFKRPAGCCIFCAISDSPQERRRGGPSASRIPYPSLRPEGQSLLIPSLRLSNANPLRWALHWGPPARCPFFLHFT